MPLDSADARRAEAAARWAFLGAWLAALQDHLYYHEREETDCGSLHSELKSFCVYISLAARAHARVRGHVGDAPRGHGAQGNPAIELFDPDDYDASDLTPSFIIKANNRWKVANDNIPAIAAVEKLLVATHTMPRSADYKAAREKIRKMDKRRCLDGFQIPVSILLAPKAMQPSAQKTYMEIVRRATHRLAVLNRREADEGADDYPFNLTDVIFHHWEFPVTFD